MICWPDGLCTTLTPWLAAIGWRGRVIVVTPGLVRRIVCGVPPPGFTVRTTVPDNDLSISNYSFMSPGVVAVRMMGEATVLMAGVCGLVAGWLCGVEGTFCDGGMSYF